MNTLEQTYTELGEMTKQDVISILQMAEANGITVYIDGGWGVDALLGIQTRKHEDLDIAIAHEHSVQFKQILATQGYSEVIRPDSWECNYVMGDDKGHLIDVHTFTLDEAGNNIYGVAYQGYHLVGKGVIDGYPVSCPPPDVMVEFHTGYEVDATDYADTKALCERFFIPLPDCYMNFYDCNETNTMEDS
ncbi:MAG: aminoglycoside nucleotidyltransferase [Oscillospiraceae bacterium]|nr:aminoglycoside nucleotidyltransferase [Oscillospiraceae bacterium]